MTNNQSSERPGNPGSDHERIPFMQRVLDNPFLLLFLGVLVATAGGVITYRALYIEPTSAVVITETGIRQIPNPARVVGGALLFVGGSALALFAATRRNR